MELAHEIVEAEKFTDLQLESQQWPSRNCRSKSQDLETWDVSNVSRRVPKDWTSLCPQQRKSNVLKREKKFACSLLLLHVGSRQNGQSSPTGTALGFLSKTLSTLQDHSEVNSPALRTSLDPVQLTPKSTITMVYCYMYLTTMNCGMDFHMGWARSSLRT